MTGLQQSTAETVYNISGICKCGCGGKTKLAPYSSTKKGWVHGKPVLFINGHQNQGKLLPRRRASQRNDAPPQRDYHTQQQRWKSIQESNRRAALVVAVNTMVAKVAQEIFRELMPEMEQKLKTHEGCRECATV